MAWSTPFDVDTAKALIDARRTMAGAALPILHALQNEFGYVDDAAIPMVADALNISKAEVLGVVTFYHDFRREAVAGPVLKLCRAESCQAAGCEDLVAHLEHRHGVAVDGKGAGAPTVESIYCLGNCALSPAALLDGEPIGRLDRDRIDAIVANARGLRQ